MKKVAIITGVTGQDGAYLSQLLLGKEYEVVGLVRSYNAKNIDKLEYLGITDKIVFEECDLLDFSSIMRIINKYKPSEIYNLAAQSSVGLSFEQPIGTMSFNILSVMNLLEAIRFCDKSIRFYQASSSEMYGKVAQLPITEETPMHPVSPYAVSKASAHWATVNYRESFGIFACCGVLFNHESALRSDIFFVKKIILEAIKVKKGLRKNVTVGNLSVSRDFGYAPDYVEAMWRMLQTSKPNDYIISSGESIKLRNIVEYVFDKLKIDSTKIVVDEKLFRPGEIQEIYGDSSKAKNELGWNYTKDFFEVLDMLIVDIVRDSID